MKNNEIRTGAMTNGEFTIQYQQNGNGGCIPVIDGKPEPSLMFGYVTESDRDACMKLIAEAIRATNGNIYQAQTYIMNAVAVAANEIKPNEVVTIGEMEILICYEDKKAYEGISEIANLDDINCELPNEAIKAMLIDRTRLVLEERERYLEVFEDEDYWD